MFPTVGHLLQYLTGWRPAIPIPTFGVLMVLSFWAAYRCFLAELKRNLANGQIHFRRPGTTPHRLMDRLLLCCAVTGFIGAIFFAKLEQHYTANRSFWPQLFSFNGLNYYGSLLFGALTYFFITARNGIPFPKAADIGSPGMMLAYGIGRIGCHLAGDGDWGIVNNARLPSWLSRLPSWAWRCTYPHNTIRQGVAIPGCTDPYNYCTQLPLPVYPTSLYEAFACVLLFAFLWSLRDKIKTPGLLFGIYGLLNGLERFFIEFIRVNPRYSLAGFQLSQAQFFAIGWMVTGLFCIICFTRRRPAS